MSSIDCSLCIFYDACDKISKYHRLLEEWKSINFKQTSLLPNITRDVDVQHVKLRKKIGKLRVEMYDCYILHAKHNCILPARMVIA